MKLVILCGGSGTRLWPISRQTTPKQFSKLINDKSLFELTIDRNKNLCDEIIVIVNEQQLGICESQIPLEIKGKTSFIIEPMGKNTAPAICMAALASLGSEILVVASDHLINTLEIYNQCIEQAQSFAKSKRLVTFGIKPTYPETGYGYIESNGTDVVSFKEKPNLETAQEYLKDEKYFWNSGMFCFNADYVLEQYKELSKDILDASKICFEKAKISQNKIFLQKEDMDKIPAESIDYAIMEKSNSVSVVKSNFEWNDLGSYDALYDILDKDKFQNNKNANHYCVNSQNNLILSDSQVIATFDVENLIIVSTNDVVMIGKKGQSQKVKELYEVIKKNKPDLLK